MKGRLFRLFMNFLKLCKNLILLAEYELQYNTIAEKKGADFLCRITTVTGGI